MFYETVITSDKSYYADKLEQLTGISREKWAVLTLEHLREHFERELKHLEREKE